MSRYIIKNCEQIHSSDNFCWSKSMFCQDCTDCLLKQIVELCSEYSGKWEDCDFSNGFGLSDEIFELLDIQEVE